MVDGKALHSARSTSLIGLWYNQDIFRRAGAQGTSGLGYLEGLLKRWQPFGRSSNAMPMVQEKHLFGFSAPIWMPEEGRALLNQPLTNEAVIMFDAVPLAATQRPNSPKADAVTTWQTIHQRALTRQRHSLNTSSHLSAVICVCQIIYGD